MYGSWYYDFTPASGFYTETLDLEVVPVLDNVPTSDQIWTAMKMPGKFSVLSHLAFEELMQIILTQMI